MKRRLLSALLAMAMLLTMVPAAFAVDNEPGVENGGDTSKTVSISVDESITLTGTAADGEGVIHTWEIDSGEDFITLTASQENPGEATVTGVDEGTAEVIHSYTYPSTPSDPDDDIHLTPSGTSETFTVIVTAAEEPDDKPEVDEDCVAYIVRDTETKEYNDLQTALNEAEDGETIYLNKNLENVAVTVEKSITLDLNEHTISGGNTTDPIILVQKNAAGEMLDSLTVKNGTITGGEGVTAGGHAIWALRTLENLNVEGVHFDQIMAGNYRTGSGGAAVLLIAPTDIGEVDGVTKVVPCAGSSAVFSDCKFMDNVTNFESGDPSGGAVNLSGVDTVSFEGCVFERNQAGTDAVQFGVGGAVAIHTATVVDFTDCVFTENQAATNGGAVSIQWSETASFESCDFTENSLTGQYSALGGAVDLSMTGSKTDPATITGCTFTKNSAPNGNGGAVAVSGGYTDNGSDVPYTEWDEDSVVLIENSTFTENTAKNGGAIDVAGYADVTINGDISGQTATGAGGAIFVSETSTAQGYKKGFKPTVTVTGDLTKNKAGNGGGALYIGGSNVTVNGNISDNSSKYGGGFYATNNSVVTINGDISNNETSSTTGGGGFYAYTGTTVTVTEGNITGNKTAGGGGGFTASGSTVNVTGNIADNEGAYGGGFYTKGNVTVNGDITGNEAKTATGGGGIYAFTGAAVTVTGNITDNTSAGYGGGVCSDTTSGTVDLSGASIYNNTANTAGADIYHNGGTLKIGEVGSNWSLDGCGHLIDGWYSDAAGARWVCGAENPVANEPGEITEETALIAAHGTDAKAAQTVTITPADIVIYTGGTGYGGVTVNEEGIIVSDPTESGLPEPGYHLELSPDVESWLQEQTQDQGAEDLSQYLTFTYQGTDGQGGTTSREWDLHNAGIYDADAETGATTQYVYTLDPATVGNESIPVRILYFEDANANGKYDEGDTVRENDEFLMDENIVYNTYAMTINPGKLDQGQIKAEFTVGGETLTCNVAIGTGDLMVKSVDEPEYTNIAANQDAVLGDNIVAVPNETVNFYVNDSDVEVKNENDRVKLLVDDVSNSEAFNNALGEAATKQVTGLDNVKFAAQYLDLVDTANGNAVVTLGDNQKLSLYWPVPSDAADDSAFHIVHYTDMDRESTTGTDDLASKNPAIIEGTRVTIGEKDYIEFETSSFSPFVLVYEGKSSSGGGTTRYTLTYESNGGTEYNSERYTRNTVVELDKVPTREGYTFTGWYADKELTDRITEIKMTSNKTVYAGWEITGIPEWLNGDDHFAYVIGYEDGTVRPESNISRAEVATIFFRLLDPEIREENLTDENTFADVGKGVWYNQAISTMAALGIVNGRTDTAFEPDAPITRAEFAAICARFDTNKRDGDSNFTDISGHWAEAEIERAATLGWINGYEDGTFRPDAEITRAEAMTLINRVLQRLPETADDLLDDMTVWPDCQPNAWYYLAVQEATNSHDFDRKADGVHESWTALTEAPDWEQYQ